MPLFGKKKKEEPRTIDMKSSPMFMYTGQTPQDTAAELNAQFRLVLDQHLAGKITEIEMAKAFLLLLKEKLSAYYLPRVTGILLDTTGLNPVAAAKFKDASDKALQNFIFGKEIT